MLKYFFLLSVFSCARSLGQVDSSEFGKVSMEEMLMTGCPFDKTAAAMVLFDRNIVEVSENRITSERCVRIKIFRKEGYKHASIIIPYIGKNRASRIRDISAYSYNLSPDGRIEATKISKKDIFKDKSEEGVSSIRFAFPGVKEGTVIEYRYDKIEKNIYQLDPWFFQNTIPVRSSYLQVTIPYSYGLTHHIVSMFPITDTQKINKGFEPTIEKMYAATNIPAFRMEPFMSSVNDNLARIEFSYVPRFGGIDISRLGLNRWQLFNLALNRAPFFGMQFRKLLIGPQPLVDSISRLQSDTAKINAVYHVVKDKVRWNEKRTFYAEDIQEAWNSGTGNSAEINFILLQLLRRTGVEAYPLLVSTKNNGKPDKTFANIGQFNSINIVAYDTSGKPYVLDAVEKHLPYTLPPLNTLHSEGFMVDSLKGTWVNLDDQKIHMRSNVFAIAAIGKDGKVTGNATISYYDLGRIQQIAERDKKKEDDGEEYLEKDFSAFKRDTLIEENLDDDSQPFINRFGFSLQLNKTGRFIFIDPFMLSSFRKNPFKDTTRNSDIDFGTNQSITSNITFTLPEHFKVEELPKSTIIRMSDSAIVYKRIIALDGNILHVQSQLQFNRSEFSREEYPALRQIFGKLYALQSEQVVIEVED